MLSHLMHKTTRRVWLMALFAVLGAPGPVAANGGAWDRLEEGLELGVFDAPRPSETGDSKIRVLRIDPNRFRFRLLNASAQPDGSALTARQWASKYNLVAAINASMYQTDHRTSVSHMRTEDHVNNPHITRDNTLLAFDSRQDDIRAVTIIDRECDDLSQARKQYGTLVQSIRMISCRGRNVWTPRERKWSTALIAEDKRGRILFIHVRSPYSTHDLINMLMELPLNLENAMYVEGGPEAQLYVRSGSTEYEWIGSFETGFNENNAIVHAWPVPNVIGIERKSKAPAGVE